MTLLESHPTAMQLFLCFLQLPGKLLTLMASRSRPGNGHRSQKPAQRLQKREEKPCWEESQAGAIFIVSLDAAKNGEAGGERCPSQCNKWKNRVLKCSVKNNKETNAPIPTSKRRKRALKHSLEKNKEKKWQRTQGNYVASRKEGNTNCRRVASRGRQKEEQMG